MDTRESRTTSVQRSWRARATDFSRDENWSLHPRGQSGCSGKWPSEVILSGASVALGPDDCAMHRSPQKYRFVFLSLVETSSILDMEHLVNQSNMINHCRFIDYSFTRSSRPILLTCLE